MDDFWMFICNPKTWNARGFIEDGHRTGYWKSTRCRIKAGDKGILRVSKHAGKEAEIYAIVDVVREPVPHHELDPDLIVHTDPYWSSQDEIKNDDLFVSLDYKIVLTETIITLDELQKQKGLSDKLFRAPQASCCEIGYTTFRVIRALAAERQR